MKFRHTASQLDEKIELQMTPMIDIVFQLLVFFIMTFKIVAQEGDFNIRMPLASAGGVPDETQLPPMKLYLTADSQGELQWPIVLNEQSFDSFPALTQYLIGLLGTESGPGSARESAEVELHFDANLRYEYVVKAIDAVSGQLDPQTGRIVELVPKIRFAPQTAGG
ncbi:MAG: biopolymer transporter ExbD [Pirellulaceae bacterium]|nr:MAG: biopolymer transporter ExbD [Pirellulaceae bacterium]